MPIEYLTCLLSLDRLRELGIKAVPHGQRDKVYKKLLQGEPHQHCERNPMLLDVNRDAGKRGRGVIAQGGSGELFSADDAASLAGDDGDPGVDGSDAALATDDEGSLVGALEQLMVEHGVGSYQARLALLAVTHRRRLRQGCVGFLLNVLRACSPL